MRAFVFAMIAALALPGAAVSKEPAQHLMCHLLGCGLPSCGDDLDACIDELASCSAASSFFTATGQATSYAAGDDGDFEYGATLSYTDNGDGTITDSNTHLVWEKKITRDGSAHYADLHDADNVYTWSAGDTGIFGWVAALNAATFAGYDDWRIPNRRELESILDFERVNPVLNPAFHGASCGAGCTDMTSPACSCTASTSFHWTSTTFAQQTAFAWGIRFHTSEVLGSPKSSSSAVRAVRGGSQ